MAWNRPTESPTSANGTRKRPKGRGGFVGWIAGVVVIAGLVAAWLYLSQASGAKHGFEEKKPSRIREQKPTRVPTNVVREVVRTVETPKPDGGTSKPGRTNAVAKVRQQLWGTESRIEAARARGARRIFKHDAEAYLSMYAEPGKPVPPTPFKQNLEEDMRAALKEPVIIDMNVDEPHEIDLKNIVQGMKEELKAYLAAGGTMQDYIKELDKRQENEANMRSEATKMIYDACKKEGANAEEAYELWKKLNQHLEAKGILPVSKPALLRQKYGRNIDDFREPSAERTEGSKPEK